MVWFEINLLDLWHLTWIVIKLWMTYLLINSVKKFIIFIIIILILVNIISYLIFYFLILVIIIHALIFFLLELWRQNVIIWLWSLRYLWVITILSNDMFWVSNVELFWSRFINWFIIRCATLSSYCWRSLIICTRFTLRWDFIGLLLLI